MCVLHEGIDLGAVSLDPHLYRPAQARPDQAQVGRWYFIGMACTGAGAGTPIQKRIESCLTHAVHASTPTPFLRHGSSARQYSWR